MDNIFGKPKISKPERESLVIKRTAEEKDIASPSEKEYSVPDFLDNVADGIDMLNRAIYKNSVDLIRYEINKANQQNLKVKIKIPDNIKRMYFPNLPEELTPEQYLALANNYATAGAVSPGDTNDMILPPDGISIVGDIGARAWGGNVDSNIILAASSANNNIAEKLRDFSDKIRKKSSDEYLKCFDCTFSSLSVTIDNFANILDEKKWDETYRQVILHLLSELRTAIYSKIALIKQFSLMQSLCGLIGSIQSWLQGDSIGVALNKRCLPPLSIWIAYFKKIYKDIMYALNISLDLHFKNGLFNLAMETFFKVFFNAILAVIMPAALSFGNVFKCLVDDLNGQLNELTKAWNETIASIDSKYKADENALKNAKIIKGIASTYVNSIKFIQGLDDSISESVKSFFNKLGEVVVKKDITIEFNPKEDDAYATLKIENTTLNEWLGSKDRNYLNWLVSPVGGNEDVDIVDTTNKMKHLLALISMLIEISSYITQLKYNGGKLFDFTSICKSTISNVFQYYVNEASDNLTVHFNKNSSADINTGNENQNTNSGSNPNNDDSENDQSTSSYTNNNYKPGIEDYNSGSNPEIIVTDPSFDDDFFEISNDIDILSNNSFIMSLIENDMPDEHKKLVNAINEFNSMKSTLTSIPGIGYSIITRCSGTIKN